MNVSKKWVVNSKFDFVYILSGLWISLFFTIVYIFDLNKEINWFVYLFLLLSCGHIIAPIGLVFKNKSLRTLLYKNNAYLIINSVIILIAPLLLMLCSGYLYQQKANHDWYYMPVFILFSAFFAYNSWHFAKQNYGIIRIYKKIYDIVDNPIKDMILVGAIQMFLITAIWFNNDYRNDFLRQYRISTKYFMPNEVFTVSTMALIALSTYYIFRYYKMLGVCFGYLQFFIVQILMLINPLFFTLTVYTSSHHLQEFGFSYVAAKNMGERSNIFFHTTILVLISIVLGRLHIDFIKYFPNVTLFGGISFSNAFTASDYFISCIFFGMWTGVNFLHFYYSKIIYKAHILKKMENIHEDSPVS